MDKEFLTISGMKNDGLNGISTWKCEDIGTKEKISKYLDNLMKTDSDEWNRKPGQMFWPPRVIRSLRDRSLSVFFGTGVSMASGLPDWLGLLRKVGLDPEVEKGLHISGDMLTMAEMASLVHGPDNYKHPLEKLS